MYFKEKHFIPRGSYDLVGVSNNVQKKHKKSPQRCLCDVFLLQRAVILQLCVVTTKSTVFCWVPSRQLEYTPGDPPQFWRLASGSKQAPTTICHHLWWSVTKRSLNLCVSVLTDWIICTNRQLAGKPTQCLPVCRAAPPETSRFLVEGMALATISLHHSGLSSHTAEARARTESWLPEHLLDEYMRGGSTKTFKLIFEGC